MSFLGNLFKKKPGGSLFGNIIRGVVKPLTGGLLGKGNNKVPREYDTDGDGKLSESELAVWKGKSVAVQDIDYELDPSTPTGNKLLDGFSAFADKVKDMLSPNVTVDTGKKTNTLIFVVLGVIGLFIFLKPRSRR